MSKYSIAWMPGDGIGKDVMDAARIVLDAMRFDAEYVHCDIGWEFWCNEGNALPDRTVKALQSTTCGLFGAITSKPQDDAVKELSPALRDRLGAGGLSYFSPIVKMRQMFNLHTNMRPCKSYAGNPLNYRGTALANPSGADVRDRPGHLPREHRGLVRRRRVRPDSGGGLHGALREPEDEGLEGQGAREPRPVDPHRQQARVREHLPPGVRVREEAPAASA
jgi:hypothetical protein